MCVFNDNLLLFNQKITNLCSEFRIVSSVSMVSELWVVLVSSANIVKFIIREDCVVLSIYNRNNKSSSVDFCGSPAEVYTYSDGTLFITAHWSLFAI